MSDESPKSYDEDYWGRARDEASKICAELRTRGVIYFDSDDDFSFELSLRDLYLPGKLVEKRKDKLRFGLFVGWQWNTDIARTFLDATAREAQIVAWRFVEMVHQGAGHDCVQQSFIVMPVRIRDEMSGFAEKVVRHYFFSCLRDPRYAQEQDTLDYIEFMEQHGITVREALACTSCLMESIYPIDCSQGNLEGLTADPDRHRRALEPLMRSELLAERLSLFLISDNCD